MKITYTLRCEPEDQPYVGNCMASGDDVVDREQEQWIRDQLRAGNEWAWCVTFVDAEVTIGGATFKGSAALGCCSYESEADFRRCEWEQQCSEARDALVYSLRAAIADGLAARKALKAMNTGS